MNLRTTLMLALAVAGIPALAQTAAEDLQRGIFAQQSQGKLDDAILIFRQLANSSLTPRDIAAQAQYRLSQALLAKGDLSGGARELERLERTFPEAKELVASLAGQNAHIAATPVSPVPRSLTTMVRAADFDGGQSMMLSAKVKQMYWVNPLAHMVVEVGTKKYLLGIASPSQMALQGATRNTFALDEILIISVRQPRNGPLVVEGMEGLQVLKIMKTTGEVVFDRSKLGFDVFNSNAVKKVP